MHKAIITLLIVVCLAQAWIIFVAFPIEEHPFDTCVLRYTNPEDQIECVWLLRDDS